MEVYKNGLLRYSDSSDNHKPKAAFLVTPSLSENTHDDGSCIVMLQSDPNKSMTLWTFLLSLQGSKCIFYPLNHSHDSSNYMMTVVNYYSTDIPDYSIELWFARCMSKDHTVKTVFDEGISLSIDSIIGDNITPDYDLCESIINEMRDITDDVLITMTPMNITLCETVILNHYCYCEDTSGTFLMREISNRYKSLLRGQGMLTGRSYLYNNSFVDQRDRLMTGCIEGSGKCSPLWNTIWCYGFIPKTSTVKIDPGLLATLNVLSNDHGWMSGPVNVDENVNHNENQSNIPDDNPHDDDINYIINHSNIRGNECNRGNEGNRGNGNTWKRVSRLSLRPSDVSNAPNTSNSNSYLPSSLYLFSSPYSYSDILTVDQALVYVYSLHNNLIDITDRSLAQLSGMTARNPHRFIEGHTWRSGSWRPLNSDDIDLRTQLICLALIPSKIIDDVIYHETGASLKIWSTVRDRYGVFKRSNLVDFTQNAGNILSWSIMAVNSMLSSYVGDNGNHDHSITAQISHLSRDRKSLSTGDGTGDDQTTDKMTDILLWLWSRLHYYKTLKASGLNHRPARIPDIS